MTEPPDPLEAELSALRPREISTGLRRRVAERLADPPHARRRIRRLALAACLAAACLAAVLLRWGRHGPVSDPAPIVGRPRPAPPAEVEAQADSEPTLLAYELALSRSPEELDELLDKHAAVAPEPNPELARISAFPRSDLALRTLLGED
jgi:hypothetical protein